MMRFSASQIAALVGGRVEGDPEASVESFSKIEEARNGQLSFLANPKYEDHLYTTRASVVIVGESLELKAPVSSSLIRVSDPYSAFARLLTMYQEMRNRKLSGVEQPSFVAPTARIGRNVYIGAFAYIGDHAVVGDDTKVFPQVFIGSHATVGSNTILHPGVKVYHECVIGNHVTVHAGTVIGSDGFGFAPQADGSYSKVPQIGNVVVEDRVEIGANTCIERATLGSTVVRAGAKLDNLIQVAHNVEVGRDTVIAAQVGVSGSTRIGNRVMIGGQAGIVGHITIADGSRINGQSGVSKSMKTPDQAVTGTPALEYGSALRAQAVFKNLPEIEKRIKELERLVAQMRSEEA